MTLKLHNGIDVGYRLSWKMEMMYWDMHGPYSDDACDWFETMKRSWEKSLPYILNSETALNIEFGLLSPHKEAEVFTTLALKEMIDIVQVVSAYTKVTNHYGRLSAKCPIHNENTPSFFIWPKNQSWYCFGGCGGGDIFAFLMKKFEINFREALEVAKKLI